MLLFTKLWIHFKQQRRENYQKIKSPSDFLRYAHSIWLWKHEWIFAADQFLSWNGAHDWILYIALCMQNEWVGSIHSQLIYKIVFDR